MSVKNRSRNALISCTAVAIYVLLAIVPTQANVPEQVIVPAPIIPNTQTEDEGPPQGAVMFGEAALDEKPFCPESYPEYAALNPEAECATWENGGLDWLLLLEGEWGVTVWQPLWRFCGVPRPYPEKPRRIAEFQPPAAWMEWWTTQGATATP